MLTIQIDQAKLEDAVLTHHVGSIFNAPYLIARRNPLRPGGK